jgi:hypothetical protein
MNARLAFGLISLAVVALTLPLSGHHSSIAEFDRNNFVSITGKLTRIEWGPHGHAFVDVTGANGATLTWSGDIGPAHLLAGKGWPRDAVAKLVGEKATMRGFWAKNGDARMHVISLTTAKGALFPDVGLLSSKDDAILIVSLTGVESGSSGQNLLTRFDLDPPRSISGIDAAPCPPQRFDACISGLEGAAPPTRLRLAPGVHDVRARVISCRSNCTHELPVECRSRVNVKRGETLYLRFAQSAGACTPTQSSTPVTAGERDIQKEIDAGRYQSLEFGRTLLQPGGELP